MTNKANGAAIPRHRVLVLGDGSTVIHRTDDSAFDLRSGAIQPYRPVDFGHRVTDAELEQLKASGVIAHYDHASVWVEALPECESLDAPSAAPRATRTYYINSTLSAELAEKIQARIEARGCSDLRVCEREGLVAVLRKDAGAFHSLPDAEKAQRRLQMECPDLFTDSAVAFTESGDETSDDVSAAMPSEQDEVIDLDLLVASQTDTSITQGRAAVVACDNPRERTAITELLTGMQMRVSAVSTAEEALRLLEEAPADVLVMDVRLPDMHGWAMLAKFREMEHAADTRVIALADTGASDQVFALTVAKVDVYLPKPISMARLRLSVWSELKERMAQTP